jgi:hypothetical protein
LSLLKNWKILQNTIKKEHDRFSPWSSAPNSKKNSGCYNEEYTCKKELYNRVKEAELVIEIDKEYALNKVNELEKEIKDLKENYELNIGIWI